MKKQLANVTRNNSANIAMLSFVLATTLMILVYKLKCYAPFGNNSLACMDANVDYIDFFCYLKDIFSNHRGLIYSFSKGLGGNMFGVITTGYFSPVNLIIVFFEKTEMESFFDIVVALKIGLSAMSMSIFLKNRLNSLHNAFVVSLSIGYGLCQYNISQASNIFFLDGSYMLPLFMLGVFYIVEKERPFLLMFSVAYLVITSWYMGAINCFFTILWSVFEFFWYCTNKTISFRKFLNTVRQLILAGFGGVLISGVVFFPTIVALRKSSEGSFSLGVFKDSNVFFGNIITAISNYYMGAISTEASIALFCSSLAFLGAFAFFISSRFNNKQKIVALCTLGIIITSYYWKPLILVFSMLKYPISFWSRYSYLGIFAIIFFAALFLENIEEEDNAVRTLAATGAVYFLIVFLVNKDAETSTLKWLYVQIASMIIVIILACILNNIKGIDKKREFAISTVLVLFISLEMSCNAILIMHLFHQPDIDKSFVDYVEQGTKQINFVKERDKGYYRINQTKTRNMQEGNLTANYDEAAMLNYWGISSYTSVPDDLQREFLDRSGYPINGEDIYVVNTSNIPVDSFLGVKYVLSDRSISGLIPDDSIKPYNGKKVYCNPYALPLLFTKESNQYKGELYYPSIETGTGRSHGINPFLYQNDLFNLLYGEKNDVFIPIDFEKETISKDKIEYTLKIPDGDYAVYGNLPWSEPKEEAIYIDGNLITHYAGWLSPSVFDIPVNGKAATVTIEGKHGLSIESEQFYAADLKKLQEIVAPLKKNSIDTCTIKDGFVDVDISDNTDAFLYTTIQYDPFWDIEINGEKRDAQVFGDTFMVLPLDKGDNHIVLKYKLGGLIPGLIATIIGLVLAAAEFISIKKYKFLRAINSQEGTKKC